MGRGRLPDGLPDWRRGLLCDPQTSGGLLIAVAAHDAEPVLQKVRAAGFASAAVVGALQAIDAASGGKAMLHLQP